MSGGLHNIFCHCFIDVRPIIETPQALQNLSASEFFVIGYFFCFPLENIFVVNIPSFKVVNKFVTFTSLAF